MRKFASILRLFLSSLRLIPHLLVLMVSPKKTTMFLDIDRWASINFKTELKEGGQRIYAFLRLMTEYEEFRNLYYYRMGSLGKIFRFLCRPMNTLFIRSGKIGPGLFIQHGFATTLGAEEIGANCWVNQQVTIGWVDGTGRPRIGDGVQINAGAKVLGNISVGSESKVGANAVVIKSVPPRCTVVGVPGRIVRRDGIRVDEAL